MVWEVQHLWDVAIPAAIGVTSAGATYFVAEKARRQRARSAAKLRSEEETRIAETGKFDAEATARRLRAYRERDPEFRQAIAAFVSGEVANLDLAEGVPYKQEVSEPGPAQSKIREMLGA